VPILSIQPLTPVTLERIVKTSLRKDPEERFQSAHDLTKVLHEGRAEVADLLKVYYSPVEYSPRPVEVGARPGSGI